MFCRLIMTIMCYFKKETREESMVRQYGYLPTFSHQNSSFLRRRVISKYQVVENAVTAYGLEFLCLPKDYPSCETVGSWSWPFICRTVLCENDVHVSSYLMFSCFFMISDSAVIATDMCHQKMYIVWNVEPAHPRWMNALNLLQPIFSCIDPTLEWSSILNICAYLYQKLNMFMKY